MNEELVLGYNNLVKLGNAKLQLYGKKITQLGFILNQRKQSYYINAFIDIFGPKNIKSLYLFDRKPFLPGTEKNDINLDES